MLGGSFDTHDIVVAYLDMFLESYKTKVFKEKIGFLLDNGMLELWYHVTKTLFFSLKIVVLYGSKKISK